MDMTLSKELVKLYGYDACYILPEFKVYVALNLVIYYQY